MTEDEAKKKTCPILKAGPCLASECMMWRSVASKWVEQRNFFLTADEQLPPWSTAWVESLDRRDAELRQQGFQPIGDPELFGFCRVYGRGEIPCGYCGMGGKP